MITYRITIKIVTATTWWGNEYSFEKCVDQVINSCNDPSYFLNVNAVVQVYTHRLCNFFIPWSTCCMHFVLVCHQIPVSKEATVDCRWIGTLKCWQLPKMEKYIPDLPLPYNLDFRSRWSVSVQLYFKNFDVHEYVKFEAISLKCDICQYPPS